MCGIFIDFIFLHSIRRQPNQECSKKSLKMPTE